MGVPAVERERAHARSLLARQEFRRGPGRFGEIGPHLLDAADLSDRPLIVRIALDRSGARNGRNAEAVFQDARKGQVGVAVVIEEPQGRLVTDGR